MKIYESGKREMTVDDWKEEVRLADALGYERGLAEGLKKSVVAKVPNKEQINKFCELHDGERYFDVKRGVDWTIEQIKAVELKMPERRKYRCVQDNNELYGREDIAHDNGTVEGWNAHDDAIIRMNPELFGEIKK